MRQISDVDIVAYMTDSRYKGRVFRRWKTTECHACGNSFEVSRADNVLYELDEKILCEYCEMYGRAQGDVALEITQLKNTIQEQQELIASQRAQIDRLIAGTYIEGDLITSQDEMILKYSAELLEARECLTAIDDFIQEKRHLLLEKTPNGSQENIKEDSEESNEEEADNISSTF